MNKIFCALAGERRREILTLLVDKERSAGEIAAKFAVSRGTVSQSLGLLREAGLVTVRRDGTRRYYRLVPEALNTLGEFLQALLPVQKKATRPTKQRGAGVQKKRKRKQEISAANAASGRGPASRRQAGPNLAALGYPVSVGRMMNVRLPPQEVFVYWMDEVRLARWMGQRARVEVSQGGEWRVEFDRRITIVGKVKRLEPPYYLSIAWEIEGIARFHLPEPSILDLELFGGVSTTLRLSHTRLFESIEPALAVFWDDHLERLQDVLAGSEPGPPTLEWTKR